MGAEDTGEVISVRFAHVLAPLVLRSLRSPVSRKDAKGKGAKKREKSLRAHREKEFI